MTELEDRLDAGPDAVEALLRETGRPLRLSDPDNWHGLAEGAAQEARWAFDRGDRDDALRWARCAVAIYDDLAADAGAGSFDLSSMHVRAGAILELGVREDDAVLAPRVVIAWVRAALTFPIEEALARSDRFRRALAAGEEPSLDDGRALRRIKNRLGVLARLGAAIGLDPDLQAWIDARDRLV